MAKETLTRISSRVTVAQSKFIKDTAKRINTTEGEALRIILDRYINQKK